MFEIYVRYRIIGTMPQDEEWEFLPGEEVECETTEVEEGKNALAAVRVTRVPL